MKIVFAAAAAVLALLAVAGASTIAPLQLVAAGVVCAAIAAVAL